MSTINKIFGGILLLAITLSASYANAQVNCSVIITSLPYVISTSNQTYCLGQNLTYNASADTNVLGHYSIQNPANNWNDFPNINFTAAIRVTGQNVTLDLNNYSLAASSLVTNRVAVAVYATNAANFKLQNGAIRGFDTGTYIQSPSDVTVNKILFDKIKLRAIDSDAQKNNTITNNRVNNFSSISRWPAAPVSIMQITGAYTSGNFVIVRNNIIAPAVTNSVDPTPGDGNPYWGTTGMEIMGYKGISIATDNTLTSITTNNGVSAYLYITGPHVTLRNNNFNFPINHPSSSLQNVAVMQASFDEDMTTEADSNRFSGFYHQFYAFAPGIKLIYSNNIFDVYPVNGNYPPLFVNYIKPVNMVGNVINQH